MNEIQDYELMKGQLDAMKKELGRQKLVSDRMIQRVIREKASFLNVADVVCMVVVAALIPLVLYQAPRVGFPWWIIAMVISLMIVALAYGILMRRKDMNYLPDGSLTEYSLRMNRVRKRYVKELFVWIPIALVLVALICYYAMAVMGFSSHWLLRVGIFLLCASAVTAYLTYKQFKAINAIIEQIEELKRGDDGCQSSM
jgi:hypothetical protein